MGLRPLYMFAVFHCEDRLYTSQSDVYRRQIMTCKDNPCIERIMTRVRDVAQWLERRAFPMSLPAVWF